MVTLSHIAVHPIKALDPVDCECVTVTAAGGVAHDRSYAFVDEAGSYVNGKRTADVHRLRVDVDLERGCVTLRREGEDIGSEFHLDDDRGALEAWASAYFGTPVSLEVGSGGTQTDGAVYGDTERTGPTLVSEATLREVASWYDVTPEEMRLRLRPNLVVEGVPTFWEEKLVVGDGRRIRIGDVVLAGTHAIPRCIVPARDPCTGEAYENFRQTFVEKRRESLPEWTDEETLDGNLYSVTVGTRIPESERGNELRVGDEVTLVPE